MLPKHAQNTPTIVPGALKNHSKGSPLGTPGPLLNLNSHRVPNPLKMEAQRWPKESHLGSQWAPKNTKTTKIKIKTTPRLKTVRSWSKSDESRPPQTSESGFSPESECNPYEGPQPPKSHPKVIKKAPKWAQNWSTGNQKALQWPCKSEQETAEEKDSHKDLKINLS